MIVCLVLGALGGWLLLDVLSGDVHQHRAGPGQPEPGNPFVPTPSSVRQDEQTSLETEAQVLRSSEVLDEVVAAHPDWTVSQLQRGRRSLVPPNTQILEVTYTANDKAMAQAVTQAVAETYLANRAQRSDAAKRRTDRAGRGPHRRGGRPTCGSETAAAQKGTDAEKLFHAQLVEALRNELVSLRAQRTALDNSEAPAGNVIAPGLELE